METRKPLINALRLKAAGSLVLSAATAAAIAGVAVAPAYAETSTLVNQQKDPKDNKAKTAANKHSTKKAPAKKKPAAKKTVTKKPTSTAKKKTTSTAKKKPTAVKKKPAAKKKTVTV